MRIRSIHIYSHDGQRRDLHFKVEGLNVITGRSSTGKSVKRPGFLGDLISWEDGVDGTSKSVFSGGA